MIVTAKYIGPFPEVTCNGVKAVRDETVRLRIPDGQTLSGCWQIEDEGQSAGQALTEKVNSFATPGAAAPADDLASGTPDAAAVATKKKGVQ